MERPEDFEERQESATENYGDAEVEGGASAATADEDRDREGRFAESDTPQQTSDTEERSTDS